MKTLKKFFTYGIIMFSLSIKIHGSDATDSLSPKPSLNVSFFNAVINNNIEVVKKALDDGANVNTQNPLGKTALHMAVNNCKYDREPTSMKMVLMLRAAKIDETIINNGGCTAYEETSQKKIDKISEYNVLLNSIAIMELAEQRPAIQHPCIEKWRRGCLEAESQYRYKNEKLKTHAIFNQFND